MSDRQLRDQKQRERLRALLGATVPPRVLRRLLRQIRSLRD